MSKYIRVSLCGGTSPGPFTIYYNQIGVNNIAQVFLAPPATVYPPATNIPLSQIVDITTLFIVVVPDSANQIILVDSNNICQPITQIIPNPTPTPTITSTPTPTPTRNLVHVTLQFETFFNISGHYGWTLFPTALSNGQVYPGTTFRLMPTQSSYPDNNWTYGISFAGISSSFLPSSRVLNQGPIISSNVTLPSSYTGPIGYSFIVGYNLLNFRYLADVYINGILVERADRFTDKNTDQGGVVYKYSTVQSFTINNGDVIKIKYSDLY